MYTNYTAPQDDFTPHALTRTMVSEWDTMSRCDRRIRLQALPLPDLSALCHLLSANRAAFPQPDHAYNYIRLLIEPMPYAPDLCEEEWNAGLHYVAYWGGQAMACRPMEDGRGRLIVGQGVALHETMHTFFRICYPPRFIDFGMNVIPAVRRLEDGEVRRAAA